MNYKKVNDIMKKVLYPFLFCDEVFKKMGIYELYSFADEYSEYH